MSIPSGVRRAIIGGGVVLLLAVLLFADLNNRGVAWRVFYNLTGEEEPLPQVVGMVEWSGRWFRVQPQTARYAPMEHTGVNPFGINVFLEQEVEIEKREQILQMVRDAGFVWLRQEFPWEDIEIHERGDFSDRRNDRNGDGVINEADVISAWDKYDNIVDLVEQYDLRLMVRMSNPPSWTHADPAIGDKAPPDELDDYINYAAAVAERYKGRITHYQIWNEPNIYPEWGNQDVDPEGYTEMLCQTYRTLKAIDPEIVVLSGALAPTNSMDYRNLNDFVFLLRMLEAGAGECFDVLSVQGYGLNSGPTDRRMRPQTITFAHVLYTRDLLVRNGYANKPIWMSETAWNPVPEPEVVPDISARYNFGQVTDEQAARYMVGAYERNQREMPYVGVMFYWYFKRASDLEQNQSWYYFRMVEPDFTPRPVYHAMQDYTDNLTPTLYLGVHQADHWAVTLAAEAERVAAAGALFREAHQTDMVRFTAHGTEVAVRWQSDDPITVYRDDTLLETITPERAPPADANGWRELRLRFSWFAETHSVRLEAAEGVMLLDTVTVYDNTVRDIVILIAVGGIVVALVSGGVIAVRRQDRVNETPPRSIT